MKKSRLLVLMALSMFLLLPTGCREKKNIDENKKLVKTEVVEMASSGRTVVYPGKIVAAQDVNLSFRIAGPIAKINVVQGKFVKQGTVLAQIEERDYKLQLEATEAEYKQIKAEAERVIELYNRGSASQNDHDKAFYGLQQITVKYNAHKNALADTKLRAPFDGYVQKVYFDASETVGAGMPVISMISSSAPEVEINMPSADFVKIGKMAETYCTIEVYEDVHFLVQYIDVAKKANLNQLYTTRFLVKPVEGAKPYPGMNANVYVHYSEQDSELAAISNTALFERDGKSCVWVIGDGNVISLRQVAPSEMKRDGKVVISEGLKAGDRIVIAGVKSLTEGDTVKILPPQSKTNIGNVL